MQTVARALREQCNIPFESFFLVAHLGKGHFAYFSGPNSIPENDLNKVFRREKFLQIQKSPSSGKHQRPEGRRSQHRSHHSR